MFSQFVEEMVTEVFGSQPLKLERMNVGRINHVFNVTLKDREIIVRLNEKQYLLVYPYYTM